MKRQTIRLSLILITGKIMHQSGTQVAEKMAHTGLSPEDLERHSEELSDRIMIGVKHFMQTLSKDELIELTHGALASKCSTFVAEMQQIELQFNRAPGSSLPTVEKQLLAEADHKIHLIEESVKAGLAPLPAPQQPHNN